MYYVILVKFYSKWVYSKWVNIVLQMAPTLSIAHLRGAEFSARIFSTNFQRGFQRGADSQCTNFNSNNLRVVSPLVYNIYSVGSASLFRGTRIPQQCQMFGDSVRGL